jgi:hypothetical protein
VGKYVFVFSVVLALAGCAKPPGDQCLDSFRASLKDPESGKVIGFADGVLTYTATNSYGARTQGKAMCKQSEGKWSRDHYQEHLTVLNQTATVLEEFNKCRKGGGSEESCAGASASLRFVGADGVNVGELTKETGRALGFE